MKRLFTLCAIVIAVVVSSCSKFDDSAIWDKLNEQEQTLNDHEKRIAALEELCKQMNTNINALQTLVEALEKRDYITNVSPVRKDGEVIGYTISFADSDTITIYHGENGKDGADGKDGYTPQIGVMKDTDGIYYWTLDGEWLLDGKGNKIQANGVDGIDGTDGSNGEDGTNGVDGITPRLKIENDYWYVSYDEGATWIELGKATGEDGSNGIDGVDGDSIFSSVTQDDEYVYFNLADGTMITLPKHDKENIQFEDIHIKLICCRNWDANFDGELSYQEAASVTTLGSAFKNNENIISFTELRYFTGLTEINEFTFYKCTNLYKVHIPDNVISIGKSAFENCDSLIQLPIVNNVTNIGESAFADCDRLTSITIPISVTEIGEKAFQNCSSLTDVATGDSVTTIGEKAFQNCSSLTNVVIGDSVTTIGSYAFASCSKLINVSIGKTVMSIGTGSFSNCNSLIDVIIPNSVTTINNSAFNGCSSMIEITIGENVSLIDEYAFFNCSKLNNIYCKALIPPAIHYYHKYTGNGYSIYSIVERYDGLCIYVPSESYELYAECNFYSGGTWDVIDSCKQEHWGYYKDYIKPYDFN